MSWARSSSSSGRSGHESRSVGGEGADRAEALPEVFGRCLVEPYPVALHAPRAVFAFEADLDAAVLGRVG
jgi:hypothetical protein